MMHPMFRGDPGSRVLLPGIAEVGTFPIPSALAYTTGLSYCPACDK